MTQETEALIASDEDLTKLFAGKPTQYRKSKSLPKFTGEAMRACAKINRIFFDDPDEAYRLFHELVPDAGEGVQVTGFLCYFAVCRYLTVRDFTKQSPNRLTEDTADRRQGQLSDFRLPVSKISVQPSNSPQKNIQFRADLHLLLYRTGKILLPLKPKPA